MDFNTLSNQSPRVLAVIEAFRTNPEFLNEFQTDPEAALSKIGVTLDESELAYVQKYQSYREVGGQVLGIFEKIKEFFGFKKAS